jgi:hypothetical protein
MKTKDIVADLCDKDRNVSSDDEKANVLDRFFSSVFTTKDLSSILS